MKRRLRQTSRRNFWLQILGGTSFIIALQFGNPRLVLPWISQHLGVAYIFVALMVPLFQSGLVISQLFAGSVVSRVALRKGLVSRIGLVLAGLFVMIFLASKTLPPDLAALVLLACATLFGLALGLFNVSGADLLAKTVHPSVRGRVLTQRVAFGGFATLAATVAIWTLLPDLAGDHLILLWLAVGAWAGAAAAYVLVRERASDSTVGTTHRPNWRQSWSLVAAHRWYARLLLGGVLLQSVEVAVPFYAIHAASLHAPNASNLSAFVVAMALGMALSGPLWSRVIDRHEVWVALAACMLAIGAGVLVLVMDLLGDPMVPFYHAFLFVPLALARESAVQARERRLSVKAPPHDRPAMVAFNNALLALAGVSVALVLAFAGHLHDIRTPLVMLIIANIVAALFVPRAFAD